MTLGTWDRKGVLGKESEDRRRVMEPKSRVAIVKGCFLAPTLHSDIQLSSSKSWDHVNPLAWEGSRIHRTHSGLLRPWSPGTPAHLPGQDPPMSQSHSFPNHHLGSWCPALLQPSLWLCQPGVPLRIFAVGPNRFHSCPQTMPWWAVRTRFMTTPSWN